MGNNVPTFKEFIKAEIIRKPNKKFSWIRVLNRCRNSNRYSYLFWFRVSYCLYRESSLCKSIARRINRRITKRYNVEIMNGAEIGEGLVIGHLGSIVITSASIIGEDFVIRQNTTIGTDYKTDQKIRIGNHVNIGANCCIIGNDLTIGDDVTIGAMHELCRQERTCQLYRLQQKRSDHQRASK